MTLERKDKTQKRNTIKHEKKENTVMRNSTDVLVKFTSFEDAREREREREDYSKNKPSHGRSF
jgi:hypothetical protein